MKGSFGNVGADVPWDYKRNDRCWRKFHSVDGLRKLEGGVRNNDGLF